MLKAESCCLEAHMYPWNKIYINELNNYKELAPNELASGHTFIFCVALLVCKRNIPVHRKNQGGQRGKQ